MTAIDILLEVFTWIGFGGFLVLAIVALAVWAADGTWLRADAIIDRDGEAPVARWIDVDGDVNSAPLTDAEAHALAGRDAAAIWYRHGWRDRMRLTPRRAGLARLLLAAGGMLALGVVCLVAGMVVYFAGA